MQKNAGKYLKIHKNAEKYLKMLKNADLYEVIPLISKSGNLLMIWRRAYLFMAGRFVRVGVLLRGSKLRAFRREASRREAFRRKGLSDME